MCVEEDASLRGIEKMYSRSFHLSSFQFQSTVLLKVN